MKKPYYNIIIQENHEPLVPIPLEQFAVESPHPYVKLGANYDGKSPYYLRETVLNNLIKAQGYLQELKPHWHIKIFDAYRPVAVQEFMVNYAFDELIKARHLRRDFLSEIELENLWSEVYQMWALPSLDPTTPPPHSTGGAIDLTLVNELGETVNMGSEIDEISPRSYPNYYANSPQKQEQEYHQLRELLKTIMTQAHFKQHPHEWWHFSFGDQLYTWLCRQEMKDSSLCACYGGVI